MVKNIFIPTDFSDCANYAVDAGLKYAQQFGATLHLYHWLEMPVNWSAMTAAERAQFPGIENYLTITTARFEEIVTANKNVTIIYSITGGKFDQVVKEYQREYPIDLIIMGSHGASGMNEFFLGSITQRAVRLVHCPVLILKSPLLNPDFNKVIYASKFNKEDLESFLQFKELVKHFVPEIHLVALQSIRFFTIPTIVYADAMEEFARLAKPLTCVIHQNKKFNTDRELRRFSQEIEADLIAISNHDRQPVLRLIMGSMVEYLVNHATIPVLSIDYKDKEESK